MLKIQAGGRLTSWYLQSVEELNLGPLNTNPSSGGEGDLNPGPPDSKSSVLTTRPHCLYKLRRPKKKNIYDAVKGNFYLCVLQTAMRDRVELKKNSALTSKQRVGASYVGSTVKPSALCYFLIKIP